MQKLVGMLLYMTLLQLEIEKGRGPVEEKHFVKFEKGTILQCSISCRLPLFHICILGFFSVNSVTDFIFCDQYNSHCL